MKPIPERAKAGRANPKGVAFLYLSTNYRTAMAEIRPWIGEYVSIGLFYTIRDLKILDLSKDENIPAGIDGINSKKGDHAFAEKVIWGEINKAFMKPVARYIESVEPMDYRPTQKVPDFIKNHGFDGLKYKSALSEEGHNVMLFDLSSAELTECELFCVKNILHSFEPLEGAKYKTQLGENTAKGVQEKHTR